MTRARPRKPWLPRRRSEVVGDLAGRRNGLPMRAIALALQEVRDPTEAPLPCQRLADMPPEKQAEMRRLYRR